MPRNTSNLSRPRNKYFRLLHRGLPNSPRPAAINLVHSPGVLRSMPRSIPLVSMPRLNNIPVCLSCQWKLSTTALQLAQAQQKRWITRTHIRRIKEAMGDWEQRANAIKKGEKQSMLSLLEERGFINQIVGFVKHHRGLQWDIADQGSVREKILTTCLRNDEWVYTLVSILLLHRSMLATWCRLWCLDGFMFMDIQRHFWYLFCPLGYPYLC